MSLPSFSIPELSRKTIERFCAATNTEVLPWEQPLLAGYHLWQSSGSDLPAFRAHLESRGVPPGGFEDALLRDFAKWLAEQEGEAGTSR